MTVKKHKTRNGKVSDIARLDVHDWLGNIIYRIKGKTSEKVIGVAILNTVKDLFQITEKDIAELTETLNGDMPQPKEFPKPFSTDWKKPVKWDKNY